jgi:hypothetical protein
LHHSCYHHIIPCVNFLVRHSLGLFDPSHQLKSTTWYSASKHSSDILGKQLYWIRQENSYFWFFCAYHGGGWSQWPRGLRCWSAVARWFESRRCRGYLSLVIVVWCQVEVSATGWSLVQRSPTEYVVSECDREASIMRRLWPNTGSWTIRNMIMTLFIIAHDSWKWTDKFMSISVSIFASYYCIPAAFLCVTCRSVLIGHAAVIFTCPKNKCWIFFEYVVNYTIITPTKCTLLLLKAPDTTICTLCLIFCPYLFQPAWVIFRGLNASAWLKLLLIAIY